MRATAYISTVVGQAETGTGAWQHVTASGTTPPGTASISVYIGDPSGVAQTIYVDDVNLQTAAPTPIDVLANDTNPDGGPKQIDSVTQPAHGTVAITGGGTGLTYQPNANYCNDGNPTDDFTYTLNGGSTATVAVSVTCDSPPVAVNDTKTVTEDSGPALLTNRDFEVDTSGWGSSNAAISRSTAEQHGGAASMQVDFNGTTWAQAFTNPYTAADPNTAYTVGMWVKAPLGYHYSFGAVALDASKTYISTVVGQAETGTGAWQHVTASGTTPPGTASISVYIGDPSGAAQTIYVDDVNLQTAAPTPIDVLANDTNPDGGPKQIDSVTQPAHGTVAITGGGTGLTYQPNANYCNDGNPTDDFTYTLNGGSTATVAVSVTCGDNTPLAASIDSGPSGPTTDSTPTDNTPPDTSIDSGPSGPTTDSTPTFGFSSSEPQGASFQCSLDSGSFATCSSPKKYSAHAAKKCKKKKKCKKVGLAFGSHTIRVRALDPAGNVDPTPATRTFTL